METAMKNQENRNPSPLNSPHATNGNQIHSPVPISRSDSNNPYPTTFVQADTCSFKQVVQMLTAQDPPSTSSKSFAIPPIKNSPKRQQQQSSFKLYERRNSNLKNSLMINTFGNSNSFSGFSPRKEILSPSLLDFPKLTLSPVTPLNEDTFSKGSPSVGSSSEEERAIAEKGFYLHPSPVSTPRDSEPQLLSLFPVTSPKVSGS